MAIRASSFSRCCQFVVLGLAAATVGCAAQPQASKTPEAPAPAYRSPADIRPEIAIKPTPALAPEIASIPSRSPAPVAAWVPSTQARPWKYIVIHHSATPGGNAAKFDKEHKAKGWDELGYHFVIDNGNGGPDGRVEVGPRWPKQKWGAHAKTPDNRFNQQGIGICLVGNFQDGRPSAKQLQSVAKLVGYLMETYRIPASNVIGHDDTKSTLCPGKNLSLAQVRTLASHVIADAQTNPMAFEIDEDDAPVNAGLAATGVELELMRSR